MPAAQDAELFSWLTNLYMLWSHLTPEMIGILDEDGDGRADAVGLHDHERPPGKSSIRMQPRALTTPLPPRG
ncbi:hypothetical protein ACTMU2_30440 [Cupriavidus basilensis]